MSSTFGGLNIAMRGLFAQQVALDTVGHNISNANTDGYSRQNVNLVTTTPGVVYGANGANQVGTGADVASVVRARNTYVDRQLWKETSTLGYAQATQSALSSLENVFQEPSSTGIQTVLNNFWTAFQNLSTNASDNGVRQVVLQRGQEIVEAVQHANQQLRDLVADTNSLVEIKVDQVNQITAEVASLNKQIVKIESNSTDHANDLRDRRDLLVDQLSNLMKVSVTEDSKGNYTIQAAGNILVDGNGSTQLDTLSTTDKDYGYEVANVVIKGNSTILNFGDGELQGIIDSRDNTNSGYKRYLNELSTISQFFQTDFNASHRAGYGTDDSTNNNFFGDGSTTLVKVSRTDVSAAVASAITFPLDDGKLTIEDDKGNSMTINFADPKYQNDNLNHHTINNLTELANEINTQASLATPPVNVKASYDVKTGKFSLAATGASKTVTIIDTDQTTGVPMTTGEAKTLINALNLNEPTKDYWIQNMQVNSLLLGSTTGLNKIAAKTGPDNIVAAKSNPNSGSLTATSTYSGATPLNYSVRITACDDVYDGVNTPTGVVTQITYSTDNFATPGTTLTLAAGATEFDLGNGVKIKIAAAAPKTIITDINGNPLTYNGDATALGGATDVIEYTGNITGNEFYFTTTQGDAAGNNAVNLGNTLKVTNSELLGDSSLDTYYTAVIGALGVQGQSAERLTENQQALVSQITNWRESTSGVNMDEELTNMIRFQKGYNAAARILTTMDEMLDKLINGTGVVGR